MSQSTAVAFGLARRSMLLIPRVLSTFFPSLVMPIFLTVAFAGAFAGVVLLPGFPASKMLDWVIPMTALQGCAFAGIGTGMGVARDLENGFYDRLLLSPASRGSLLAAPLIASMLRAMLPLTLLTIVALLAGANFKAGLLTLFPLVTAGLGIAVIGGAWATGLALRFKTMQVTPLMQMGLFLTIFLSTAQMPLEFLGGWLHTVARFNPMTNILALARQGFLGDVTWDGTWPGLVALAGMAVVLIGFAARSMQKVIP